VVAASFLRPDEVNYRSLINAFDLFNRQSDFEASLAAILDSVCSLAAIQGIAVSILEGGLSRPYAYAQLGVSPRRDEPLWDYISRAFQSSNTRPLPAGLPWSTPKPGTGTVFIAKNGKTLICNDLSRECRFPEDRQMIDWGWKGYVRVPLSVFDEPIGSVLFCCFGNPCSVLNSDQIGFLEDLAKPIATALSRLLAYERLHARFGLPDADVDSFNHNAASQQIVGESFAVCGIMQEIQKIGRADATVLITGETGTGKELVAKAIHSFSKRSNGPFLALNCGMMPEQLMAAELFGHEKGAFTSAAQRRLGRFELASEGTIFLDEVAELPPAAQATLLRVLEDGTFERLGGSRTLQTGARVVAATNVDLADAVSQGRFRKDLFYRLNVLRIHVPPLRERCSDIPALAEHFIRGARKYGTEGFSPLSSVTMDALRSYQWPGNVREMRNVIERAAVVSDGHRDIFERSLTDSLKTADRADHLPFIARESSNREQSIIEMALKNSRGRVSGPSGAAIQLGIPASTFEYKIKKYRLDKRAFRYPD
jgi:transcriptional regulator with GAF, ATPase, and Fis domain